MKKSFNKKLCLAAADVYKRQFTHCLLPAEMESTYI